MTRRPGRPRVKIDGVRISAYVSNDIIKKIDEHTSSKISRSMLIEELLRLALDGKKRYLELIKDLKMLNERVNELERENERLRKERNYFERKVEKLSEEVNTLKKKWNGQTTLKKWERKAKEYRVLVELINGVIDEGKTWKEVMTEVGIIDPQDQIEILRKLFRLEGRTFISEHIPGWELKPGADIRKGYFGYVFHQIENSPTRHLEIVEVA